MTDLFNVFDQNGDGFISKEELKSVMQALSHPEEQITEDDIDEMMEGYDKLDQDQFEQIIGNIEHPTSKIHHTKDTNLLTIVETSESNNTLSHSASKTSYKAGSNFNNNNNSDEKSSSGIMVNIRRALFCGLFSKL